MRLAVFLIFCITALHVHAQLGDKVRLLLNGDPNALPNFDTSYIASYRSALTLSLLTTYQSVDVDIEPEEGDDLGYSANTVSLLALVLAVGIVVDDAIVVVENIERKIEDGLEPRAAAHAAMTEVTRPIISIVLV